MKKKNIFSLFLALLLLLGMAQPALAADTAAAMQLSSTAGTVTISNASGRSLSLRDNMRLYSGYQIQTAANSYAWINLDSTKLIKLDASSKVEIRKSGKKLEVLLKSGNLYGNVSKPLASDETLDVRTSTAIVGIRGTKFSVAQVKSTQPGTEAARWTTQVQVYEGAVAVTAQQETPEAAVESAMVTTTVTAGTQVTVAPGTQETEVFVESKLDIETISGCAAVELVNDPETLENLGLAISPETAQELLERDQTEAAQKQAEADAGKTGLETAADPDIVWEADSKPSPPSGGGSGGGNTPRPEPEPVYTVTFNPNGGTGGGTITAGDDGLLPNMPETPVREGYTFTGWYTDPTGGTKVDLTTHVFTANTSLFAQWTVESYTVTFDLNGLPISTPPSSQTVQYGDPVQEPSIRTSTYKVHGWFTEPECTNQWDFDNNYMGARDMTLYAKWEKIIFSISFNPNGGTGTMHTSTGEDGKIKPENIPEATREGYAFLGWFTDPDGGTEINPDGYVFTADTTLYAQWTIKTYTVTFDGCDDQVPPQTVEHGGHATRPDPDPVREGYVFDDWYGSTSYGTPIDFDTYTVLSNVWLEAKFELGKYTVTFDLNGGPDTVTQPDSQTVSYQYKVPRPSLDEPDGYRLLGWFKEPECINEWNFDNDLMGGADMTLYAKWQQVKFKITFDPNGLAWNGDTTPVTLTTDENGKLDTSAIPADPTDIEGRKTFNGWFLELDFSKIDPVNDQFTADVTLKADWNEVA